MYIIYIILVIFSFIGISRKFVTQSSKLLVLCWFPIFVALGTFAFFSDDYEPYEELVNRAYVSPFGYSHIEPFWIWFMGLFNGDIDKFRFFSFLLIGFLLYIIIEVSKVPSLLFLANYTLLCLSAHLCWIRQPVAYCMFFLALLFADKRKLLSFLFVIIGCYIHKSSILLLWVFPFLFIPINKKVYLSVCIVAFPFLFFIFFEIIKIAEAYLGINLEWYVEAKGEYASRNIVFSILSLSITFIQFWLYGRTILLLKDSVDFTEKILVRSLFGVLYLSFFLYLLPINADTIFRRLLAFGSMIVALLWSKNLVVMNVNKKYIGIFILILFWVLLRESSAILNNYTRWYRLFMLPYV